MCWSIDRWGEIEELKRQPAPKAQEGERATDKEAMRELLEGLAERRAVEISAGT